MKKREIIIILAIIGTLGVIATSLPIIEVSVNEYYLEIHETWFGNEVHVNYPVTVEKEWNSSVISYDLVDDRFYIYWIVPIAQNRDIDYHVETIDDSTLMVFSEDEFSNFQKGKASNKLYERDEASRGTLSFVSNSSKVYVFVCVIGSEIETKNEFSIKVSWLFSTLEEEITSYRTEIEYLVKIRLRSVPKKVTISQRLFGNY